MTDIGERFVDALGRKDAVGLLELLDPAVDFRGLTPGKVWETSSAVEAVEGIMLGSWFTTDDHISAVEEVETATIVDRHRVGYRFRGTNGDATYLVEQQAYYEVADDKITWMRVVCSGMRELPPG